MGWTRDPYRPSASRVFRINERNQHATPAFDIIDSFLKPVLPLAFKVIAASWHISSRLTKFWPG